MEPTQDHVDGSGLSQSESYYKTVLAQCETVEANVSDVQQHLSSLLEYVTGAGHSGVLLADALVRLFAETPLWSVAVRYKEKTESLRELSSRTTSQVSQEVSSVLHKYTHLTPGTKSAVEGHQKSLRQLDSARERVDELGSTRNVERRRQAETRFERATEEYVQSDVRLVKAVQDIYDQKIQMLGPALLTLFQSQASYYTQAADLLSGLGKYRQVGDFFGDARASNSVKEATAQWLAAAQANAPLRKNSLSHNDVQCILLCAQGHDIPDHMKLGLSNKIDRLLQEYKKELDTNSSKHFEFLGGFHLNPKGVELALEGCCSDLEAKGAGGWKNELTPEETMAQIYRDTSRVEYRIGEQWFETISAGKVAEGTKAKLKAVCEMLKTIAPSHASPSQLEEFAVHVLNETCSTVANCAARTAVQLMFGVANLVLVKPSSDVSDNRPTLITCQRDTVRVDVSSCWWLVEDTPTLYNIRPNVDPLVRLGSVDAVYQRTFSVANWLAKRDPPLPLISVKWQQELVPPKSPTESTGTARSLRNSFSRVSMRITSKLNRHSSERRSSGNWKENVCPPQATFQSYVDLEDAGEKAENRQTPSQSVGPPLLNANQDGTLVVQEGGVREERLEGGKEEMKANVGEKQESEENASTQGGSEARDRPGVVKQVGEACSDQATKTKEKAFESGLDSSAENAQGYDDMQKTDTHLASQAELQSVIDFLSGYPVSNRSLQQMGNVGTVPYGSMPFNYEFDPDLFDGFVPPQQWPRSCSSGSSTGRSSFNGRNGSLGRNRGGSLGRNSRGSGYSDVYQDDVTPYGYDVIYEVTSPIGRRSVGDRLTGRLAGTNGPVGERLDFTSGFDMAQQGIDPVRFPALPNEMALLRSASTDFFNGGSSRQSSLSPHQSLASPNNGLQQNDAEVLTRSPATWPRGKASPWASGSSAGHSKLHQTVSAPSGAGLEAMQGKVSVSSLGSGQPGQHLGGVVSPRAFSSGSSSPSGSPPLSPGRSISQQPSQMSYAATVAQSQRVNGNSGRRNVTPQQFGVGLARLQDWEKQWNFQQQDIRRLPQS